MKVKCPKCGYEWETKITMVLATCPSCAKRFDRIKNQVKE
jgi:hypothetical protein